MSTRRAAWVQCDAFYEEDENDQCDAQAPAHNGCETIGEARRVASSRGWHRSGDRDICPWCWSQGKR